MKLLSLVLIVAATSVPAFAVAGPSTGCAQVEVVGARGTNEAMGFGYLLTPIVNDIVSSTSKTVDTYPLPYPASDNYVSSEQTGVSDLQSFLTSQATTCPNQLIVLLGYSQGAQVVGDVLAGKLAASIQSRIIAVTDFGDPLFNSRETFDVGTYRVGVNGVLGARSSGALSLFSRAIQNYCNGNDGICQAGQSIIGHLQYQNTAAAAAETFILDKIGR